MPERLIQIAAIERSGPFRAVFSTRHGGVSEGPYASLNLGLSVGDDAAAVTANRGRFFADAGVSPAQAVVPGQVHGSRAVWVTKADGGRGTQDSHSVIPACDILLAEQPVALVMGFADCVPVYLADPETGRVALVHSGWRGTVARAAAVAVQELAARGSDPGRLVAALGPCIGPCCYQVSDDVAQAVREAFGPDCLTGPQPLLLADGEGHWRLDLRAAIAATLSEWGVKQVTPAPACTACAPNFFSHRRDRGRTGRHWALLQWMAV